MCVCVCVRVEAHVQAKYRLKRDRERRGEEREMNTLCTARTQLYNVATMPIEIRLLSSYSAGMLQSSTHHIYLHPS